jgi:hypothetical protein
VKRIVACLVCVLAAGCGGASVWKDFKPESGTAIVGRVVDPKGLPVQSAQVTTSPDTDTEFTNEEGYFAIQVKRTPGTQGGRSVTAPLPQGPYQVLVDKGLYRPHDPVPVRFSGGVLQVKDVVLVPEPIDLDITGFRPAKSDPTLPGDAADPKRE